MIINPYIFGVGIDDEYANSSGEVLFDVQGDSTTLDSNNSTGPGPVNNGKIWNGSSFVSLGTVGPGVGTTDGSFCQQFALDYYTRTGKVVCFVNSGIGGSKCVDTWNGSSATFNTAMSTLAAAKTAGGFPKVRFILMALVNDSTAGESVASVNAAYNAWIDAIVTAYPTAPIYYSMFGVKSGQTTRAQVLRCNVIEKHISTSNLHITHSDLYLDDWGLIGADGVHPTQAGHNFRGSKIDTYLGMESLSYSKFARTIINGQYSTWTLARAAAVNTAISDLVADDVWHNMLGFWSGDFIHANDRFVDWRMISRLTDRGVTYVLDDFLETDTGETLNMPITTASLPYRTHSTTDTFVSIRVKDYKSTTAATHIPFGVSSGTNIYALQVGVGGLISGFVRNNTAITLAGGIQDNSRYTLGRSGTAVNIYVNGLSASSGTSTAGADLTTGPEVGDRYTAGPAGFAANMELKDYCMGLDSVVDQAALYSRLETMYASI